MKKIKIAYITTHEIEVIPLLSAYKGLRRGNVQAMELYLRSGEDLKTEEELENLIKFSSQSHLIILNLHGGRKSLSRFDDIFPRLKDLGVPIHAQSSSEMDLELMNLSSVEADEYTIISKHINYGGKENFTNLFLHLANQFVDAKHEITPPERPPWQGIYHPQLNYIPTIQEYLNLRYDKNKPTVGLWIYQSFWQSENLNFVDRLIEEIERQDANVLPVFLYSLKDAELGTKGMDWVIENYFMMDGKPLVDVVISPLMFSFSMRPSKNSGIVLSTQKGSFASDDEDDNIISSGDGLKSPTCANEFQEPALKEDEKNKVMLEELGVPVIKAILTSNTLEGWKESFQGLNPIDVSMSVAMPEFDGILISVPVAARERTEIDPLTGARITRYIPIEERIQKIVKLSLNWARLRRVPNQNKRVAIILHNYPPRNDRIGTAFGLDTPVSVWNIMRDLKNEGYVIDHLPKDGQKLIEDMLDKVTNDRRWSSLEEMTEKAVDTVSLNQYMDWFEQLPQDVKGKMVDSWGPPPGELFSYQKKLIIPGILKGNVFLGIQPPRGFLEDSAAIYHSPDHPIPHHYYAYYRWIRDVFGAHVIMHVGKHGSLEWLPGKSVGLSESCFPDIAISDLPNVYPYIINDPGEGTQAKRRSYCCIVDHMVPVIQNADSYEELAELDVLIKDYHQASSEDPGKLPDLKNRIWSKVCEAKLNYDLDVDEKAAFSEFDEFLEKLHDYLYELADTQIRDGLHILGEPPRESRLNEFLTSLTRLNNGNVPSLRESLAQFLNYDYDYLLANRGKVLDKGKGKETGKTGGQIIEEIHSLSLLLMEQFQQENFSMDQIKSVQIDVLGKRDPSIEEVLAYVGSFLAPALEATTDELSSVLAACSGRYVLPGPSGAPTRGMADILPTGRNFYSVDPKTIPSTAAWKVGISMADALLDRYLEDEGQYPENIGIIIWGSPTMRTKGDDIAEILYLMGIRPLWETSSGRVEGLEPIPLEELGRPRIDVTLRISGLFRDAFSNIVELIDQAVEMAANLNEGQDENYLSKHVREDLESKLATGMDPERAKEEACYRIFGCRPGAYGAGVSDAIDSKNWKDEQDLAEIYVKWGGYAYGQKNYGITVPQEFKRRLSQLDLTVKNDDTREFDMLDGDDFYSYHGGMIATVKALKGELPKSYCGDSSDPNRVKTRSTFEETKHIFRARILNPKWIDGMKRHGYKGAADLSRMVDIAFGWDATAEVLEDWMYDSLAEKYALDEDMQEWLKEVNPYALQNIAERLLEAIERDMWDTTEDMKEELRSIYLEIDGMIEDQ